MFICNQVGFYGEMDVAYQNAEDEASEAWYLLDALFRDCICMYFSH